MDREEKERLKANEKILREEQRAREKESREKAKLEARRAAREYIDDMSQLDDVNRHILALQEQLKKLKTQVSAIATHASHSPAQSCMSIHQFTHCSPLISYVLAVQGGAAKIVSDVEAQIVRAQAILQGPPPGDLAVLGDAATASLLDALAVTDFLSLFGHFVGLRPASLAEVQVGGGAGNVHSNTPAAQCWRVSQTAVG